MQNQLRLKHLVISDGLPKVKTTGTIREQSVIQAEERNERRERRETSRQPSITPEVPSPIPTIECKLHTSNKSDNCGRTIRGKKMQPTILEEGESVENEVPESTMDGIEEESVENGVPQTSLGETGRGEIGQTEIGMRGIMTSPPSTSMSLVEGDGDRRNEDTVVDSSLPQPDGANNLRDELPTERYELKKTFNKFFNLLTSKVGSKPKRLLRFGIRPNHPVLLAVDKLLNQKLAELEKDCKSSTRRHKLSKIAILAAAYTLRKRVIGKVGALTTKPKFIETEEKIRKLKKRVKNAGAIQEGVGMTKAMVAEAKKMRKLRMVPTQYIKSTEDRITLLEEEVIKQKARHETSKLRNRFQHQQSMKVLNKRSEGAELDYDQAEEAYVDLYRKKADMMDTPKFDEWLVKIQDNTLLSTPKEMSRLDTRKLVAECMKTSSLWKAPGHDQIPNFVYRNLPAAKEYLLEWVADTLDGKYVLNEEDVKGLCYLIYKDGDQNDVLDYRPISLLNTDYKMLTKVTSCIIKDNLVEGMIPKEQLARENT
uniref:Reverse transcriptase domain-containing protein n=1 Tax=Rhabditophanes sp. KR3021 TaxID=114890 RepID=A0AC35TX56_9BILA